MHDIMDLTSGHHLYREIEEMARMTGELRRTAKKLGKVDDCLRHEDEIVCFIGGLPIMLENSPHLIPEIAADWSKRFLD